MKAVRRLSGLNKLSCKKGTGSLDCQDRFASLLKSLWRTSKGLRVTNPQQQGAERHPLATKKDSSAATVRRHGKVAGLVRDRCRIGRTLGCNRTVPVPDALRRYEFGGRLLFVTHDAGYATVGDRHDPAPRLKAIHSTGETGSLSSLQSVAGKPESNCQDTSVANVGDLFMEPADSMDGGQGPELICCSNPAHQPKT